MALPAAAGQPASSPSSDAILPASAAAYEEERIGEWSLRTDRKARTFGAIWMDTGVIELAARTSDGKAEIVIRDNGAQLSASLETPACMSFAEISQYDGDAGEGNTLAEFGTAISGLCPGTGYEAAIRSWLRDFPAAARVMKARARAIYGPDLTRCIEPSFDPEVPPPPHPRCGFPPPSIGENHPD